MLRWVYLCVAVVALAVLATILADRVGTGSSSSTELIFPARETRVGPQPKVQIEGPLTHEFGNMTTQKSGTHKWVVKNVGEGDLEIFLAGSNCMCTVAKLSGENSKETVKPGGATEIEVEWKTKDQVGEFAKNVTIGTNDELKPEFRLNVHGRVQSPIIVYPEPESGSIRIGDLSNEKDNIVPLAVFSPDRPEMKLTSLLTSKPAFINVKATPLPAKDLDQLKAKAGYRVDVEFKAGMPQGDIREELIIETDNPDKPKLQFNLLGTSVGPINVIPYRVQIIATHGKKGATGQLNLLVREGRPTRFTVEKKPQKIEVEIAPNETATLKGRYRLTVTVPPGTAPGLIDDEIVLKTDHPKVPEVKIPVNIVVGAS